MYRVDQGGTANRTHPQSSPETQLYLLQNALKPPLGGGGGGAESKRLIGASAARPLRNFPTGTRDTKQLSYSWAFGIFPTDGRHYQ